MDSGVLWYDNGILYIIFLIMRSGDSRRYMNGAIIYKTREYLGYSRANLTMAIIRIYIGNEI